MKYRKTTVIEVQLYDGTNGQAIREWSEGWAVEIREGLIQIATVHGPVSAKAPVYVARGGPKDYCPLSPEILAKAYEPAEGRTDKERLDFIQAQTKGFGLGWMLQESHKGRGLRLHETEREGAVPDVREAIDRYIFAATGCRCNFAYGGPADQCPIHGEEVEECNSKQNS